MTQQQAAAFIAAQTTLMQCEMAGMLEENKHRTDCGDSIAYGEQAFEELRQRYEPVIGYNAVMQLYRQCID